jgi:hypothetical protein
MPFSDQRTMNSTEQALFQSLVKGPLLVGDLPEAATFPHRDLSISATVDRTELNLQQKLGHLYESALGILLEASPQFDLLARNLQIQKDAHTTVGELDFLLRDLGNDGQLIHLELATKFYLAVHTGEGLTLPGPDARDNYFRKIRHLREHQLILAEKHRAALPERFRDEPIVVRQLIYGCVFDPSRLDDQVRPCVPPVPLDDPPLAFPEFLNPHCRRGRWLSIDRCSEYFPPDTEFRIIPKSLWPVPLEFLEDIPLERWTPQSPTQVERCVMVRVNDDPVPCFIAPSGYPQQRAGRLPAFSV